jgi:uncharacterized membrane protein YtjA (UPF0391 family)
MMLRWALIFLVVAMIAALFGFGGVAAVSTQIAQVLFFVFLLLFVIAAAAAAFNGRTPPA